MSLKQIILPSLLEEEAVEVLIITKVSTAEVLRMVVMVGKKSFWNQTARAAQVEPMGMVVLVIIVLEVEEVSREMVQVAPKAF